MEQSLPRSQSFNELPIDTIASSQRPTQDCDYQEPSLEQRTALDLDSSHLALGYNSTFDILPQGIATSGAMSDYQPLPPNAPLDQSSEAGTATSHSSHLQSTNDRLRKRVLQLEVEYGNLRGKTRTNREALKSGEEVLDSVMADSELPAHLQVKLTDVADVLASTIDKMVI